MILLLFTSCYPYTYTAEYTFIQHELPYLVKEFERVILVPRVLKGEMSPLPAHVEVNEHYAASLQSVSGSLKMARLAISSQCFFRELRKCPAIWLYPAKMLKLILFSGRAELTRRWLKEFSKTHHLDLGNCILYSYWFDHTVTGLAMIKQEIPSAKLVSRAHGYDIYEEYYYPYYWPYRRETLNILDRVFFASEAGMNYFYERYPEHLSKYETIHLGVTDPGFLTKSSSNGTFRIVSCSSLVPVKRLDLLLDGIAAAARLRPKQKFEWIHFGGGKAEKSLSKRVARYFPSNAQGQFLGQLPNQEILEYYRNYTVDVFMNVSSTEGGAPVAIQEAISCGIPVIATAVGGNPEIVSERNGILMSPNPTPEEIAKAVFTFLDHPEIMASKRRESRAIWVEHYNADVNFPAFAERLKSIGEK